MGIREQYENARDLLLNDNDVHRENRIWLKDFFEKEEYKLKRRNGLAQVDDRSYKTLVAYVYHIKNVLKWFNQKPLKRMSEREFRKEFKRVYDGLEDGTIKTSKGLPYEKAGKEKYYNTIFRSKPFEMLGKVHIVKEIMEFHTMANKEGEVRFFEFDTFKKMVDVAVKPEHRALFWLAFDIGENIDSLLQTKKKLYVRRVNPDTKEDEYIINLPQEILKRSRTPRSEITNFKETTRFLDIIFKKGKKVFVPDNTGDSIHKVRKEEGGYRKVKGYWKEVPFEDEDLIFNFEYRQAVQILDRVVNITKAVIIPSGDRVTWKDFRSSMACYLLREGWSRDEINARLGHKPSSREIDKYINFLAINKERPKKKVYENTINKLTEKVEEFESREKLSQLRFERLNDENKDIREELERIKEEDKERKEAFEEVMAGVSNQTQSFIKAMQFISKLKMENPEALEGLNNFLNESEQQNQILEFEQDLKNGKVNVNELNKLYKSKKGKKELLMEEKALRHIALNKITN